MNECHLDTEVNTSKTWKQTDSLKMTSVRCTVVKTAPTSAGDVGSIPGSGRGREWQPTPVFLSGKSHRSLAGYGPWGQKESWT